MMTKWDTIQADVADAYVYLDEEEMYNKALAEGAIDLDADDLLAVMAELNKLGKGFTYNIREVEVK